MKIRDQILVAFCAAILFTNVISSYGTSSGNGATVTSTMTVRQITPSISVGPTFGLGGTHVTVTGSNFSPNQDLDIFIGTGTTHDLKKIADVKTDGSGAFTSIVQIPFDLSPGSYFISVHADVKGDDDANHHDDDANHHDNEDANHSDNDDNTKAIASAPFMVSFPKITVYPTSGAGGTLVTVTGSDFGLNQGVDIFIGTDITHHLEHIGEVAADGTGSFSKQVRIPSDISAGSHVISAREDHNSNVFAAAFLTVLPASTTTTVSWSHNPSKFGQSVTFTARVTPDPDGGLVTFYDGSTPLGSDHVRDSGQATFSTSLLSIGTHHITAKYSGDPNFLSSTSSILTQIVNKK